MKKRPSVLDKRRAFFTAKADAATTPGALLDAGVDFLKSVLADLPERRALEIADKVSAELMQRAEEVSDGRA